MKPSQIARWIREEHDKVDELADRLREKIASVPGSGVEGWQKEVRERFEHFRAHLNKHMALEEHEGYMPAVLDQRPNLSGEVERLKHEHGEIMHVMDGIHAALHKASPGDRLLLRDCCSRIRDLLSYVEHHERHENVIVLSAFTDDIGTKD